MPPDYNLDGAIDVLEMTFLATYWLADDTTARLPDLDDDWDTDLHDFVLLAESWLADIP